VRIEVAAIYLDDEGRPIWGYSHGENVPNTGDPEQNLLRATGLLNAHLDGAKSSIAEQSAMDLKSIREAK
jgi:hypothetical protein